MTNNCPQCGIPNEIGAAFCDNCGAALPTAMPQPTAPAYAPPPTPTATPMPPMAASPTPAAGGGVCAQCGTPITPGATFCDNCGAPVAVAAPQPSVYQPPIQQPPAYQPPVQQPPVYQQPQQSPAYQQPALPMYGAAPHFIVQATNAQIMLPPGKTEYIVGREDPVSNIFPEVDLTPHGGDEGGVSRRHARLFQQGGQWFLEDYQSTNFTHVNNQRVQPGSPVPVPNGAEIRFGRVKLTFYTQ